jgi:hypothetical protein
MTEPFKSHIYLYLSIYLSIYHLSIIYLLSIIYHLSIIYLSIYLSIYPLSPSFPTISLYQPKPRLHISLIIPFLSLYNSQFTVMNLSLDLVQLPPWCLKIPKVVAELMFFSEINCSFLNLS